MKGDGRVLGVVAGMVALVSTAAIGLPLRAYGATVTMTAPTAGGTLQVAPATLTIAPPSVTTVTLTSNLPSPQPLNTTIVWTAAAKGGTAPQYRFWVQPPGGPFTLARDYGPSNTFAWAPATAGNYTVIVWAQSSGSAKAFDAFGITTFSVTTAMPVTTVNINPDGPGPEPVGTRIVWTATPIGGSAPEFQFWARASGEAWTVRQAYGSSNTFTHTLTRAGDFEVCVWARSGGSPALWEAYGCDRYTVTPAAGGPMTGVALAASALLLGAPLILMLKKSLRESAGGWLAEKPLRIWMLPLLILAYYTAVALAVDQWNLELFMVLAGYFGLPTFLLYLTGPKSDDTMTGRDLVINLVVVLWLWTLIELRIVQTDWLHAKIARGRPTSIHLGVYAAMMYALLVLSGWRRFNLKCDLSFKKSYLVPIAGTTGVLGVVLLSLTFSAGLVQAGIARDITLNPLAWPLAIAIPIALVAGFPLMFFGLGMVEELVFRGAIQNLLAHLLKPATALFVASAAFGVAHLNKSAFGFGFPNWPYVGIATIAGLGYGFVFWKTESIVASATVHTIIDLMWIFFLRGGK